MMLPVTPAVERSRRSLWCWRLTWFSWAMLLGQTTVSLALTRPPWIIWLGILLPLALFVHGMLHDRMRSFIWLCLVSLPYFVVMVERLFATPQALLPWVGMVAVVALYCSAMLYVRWRGPELRAAALVAVSESLS